MGYADHRLMQGGLEGVFISRDLKRRPNTARHWVSLLGSVFDNRSADNRHPTSGSPARMDGNRSTEWPRILMPGSRELDNSVCQ